MKEVNSPEIEEESNLGDMLAGFESLIIRRRWWILLPACAISLATVGVLRLIPNRYTSAATLLVVSQQVPQRYVVPNSTTDLGSTLEAMKQEVLSRTRLWQMITDLDLYPKQRKRLAPEQIMSLMLADIDIAPIAHIGSASPQRDFDSFKISFTAENPVLAQHVTSTLTSVFINENLRTRGEQASNTTKFLHDQVEIKRRKLEEQEQQLRDFKLRHVGELPEQQQGNLSVLSGLQSQLQNTTAAIGRANQQRVYLQSLLDAYRRATAVSESGVPAPRSPNGTRALTPVEIAQNDLTLLESKRTQLLNSLTPEHPDVLKNQREIAKAEETLRRLGAQPRKIDPPDPAVTAVSRPVPAAEIEDPAVAQTKGQLEANRIELQNLTTDEKRLKLMAAQYENRLNQTPVREQEQAGIVRDTEALRLEYADLLKKEQESQLATNLEKQQGGQQFRLVDTASLPEVPSSPKRMKLSLSGLGIGVVLGIALAFLVEVKDTSLHTEKDMAQYLAVPLSVTIPLLPTPMEEDRRKLKGRLELVAGSVLVLTILAAQVYVYKVH